MILFGILGIYLFLHIWEKYFIKIGKIRAKIHEIGKIKAIFGLGMTPIYGLKNGQIKSLTRHHSDGSSSTDGGCISPMQQVVLGYMVPVAEVTTNISRKTKLSFHRLCW